MYITIDKPKTTENEGENYLVVDIDIPSIVTNNDTMVTLVGRCQYKNNPMMYSLTLSDIECQILIRKLLE